MPLSGIQNTACKLPCVQLNDNFTAYLINANQKYNRFQFYQVGF